MAASESGVTVQEADVTSFAEKLDAWARDLTPAEQTLLHRLLTRAASAETDDAEGYIIIVNSLPAGNLALGAGQPSLLLRQAVGHSDFRFVKVVDKTTP